MISRDDMLELTRRMTLSRNCFARVAGAYMDEDGEWLEGSEEVYDFLICAISPLEGEYEPGKPEFGFLFPAFVDRSSDSTVIDIFNADPDNVQAELMDKLLDRG